jgi:hypothetical protein
MSATRKAIEQLDKYTKELKQAQAELLKVEKGTKKYDQALAKHKKAYDNARMSAKKLQVAMGNLSTTFRSHRKLVEQGGDAIGKFTQASEVAGNATKKSSNGFVGAAKNLIKYGVAFQALNLAIKAFKFFTTDSLKAGIEFEKNVANLSAVAGVSGNELQQLSDTALNVAGSTKFTANEIVGLQTELSKLGFSAEDVVKATASIAFGAQALGESLDVVASQVGKIINQFNLLAEESGLVVDTIVTTINESALSMSSFGTAIQYVGPLASGLGFSLQETAGAMALLADNGFTASRIGTGLRGIFTELGTETIDLKSKLKELGDQNLSLSEAVELVGKRNAAQLITLVDNIEVVENSKDTYYSQGRALQAAATQADTFSGQMDILSSAINEYQIGLGQAFIETGFFRSLLATLAPEAGKVASAFRVIREIGAEAVSGDLSKLVKEEATARELAIQRTAETTGLSIDRVTEKLKLQEGYTQKLYGDAYGRSSEFVQSNNQVGQSVLGLIDKYKQLAEQERENIIVSENREKIQDEFEPQLQELIIAEQLGEDITDRADVLANFVKGTMAGLVEEIKFSEGLIKTYRDEGREADAQREEDDKLAREARLKELSSYYRLIANLIGIELEANKEADKIERRRSRNFKELLDQYEDYKDTLKRTSDLMKIENEANEDYMENTQEQIDLNYELKASNDALIERLQEKKAETEAAMAAEDASTKQGVYNISVQQREIETLDRLIEKYNEKNEALMPGADLINLSAQNFQKQLKALEDEYNEGDIGTGKFNEGRTKLLEDYKKQLLAIAGDDSEMISAVEALFAKTMDDQENPIDWREILTDGLDEAIGVVSDAIGNFNDTAFENLKNRLEAEKEALKSRYETEDYLAKQQFENGLINESQYRRRQAQLRKKQVADENAIDKKLFDAEQQRDKGKARTDYLESLASIIPELIKAGKVIPTDLAISSAITAALATAAFGAEVSAINQRQFIPKKFAEGGMVHGPSHNQGGIPFSVSGHGGYEMEGGEFIVNKRASSLHRDLLERINNSVKPNVSAEPMKFAQGGFVNTSVTNVSRPAEESVNYLKAIAEATTNTAINSSKPVRAFVTSSDLRKDETARRIKDNNTTI